MTARQIEAARRVVVRYIRKGGKFWVRVFPDKPITFHGSEQKMGKGKGAVEFYVAHIKPGTVIIELSGVSESQAKEALTLAGHKLPVRTKVISRQ